MKPIINDTLTSIILEIDEMALIDRTNKVVYFLNDDYDDLNVTTFIIDGEEYRQKNTVANSYGIVEKTPRQNKKLKRKLKEIEQTIDKYEIEIIKGIDAYNAYGYKYVFGVVKLSRK